MKDAYKENHSFEDVRETLHTLFKLFKDSGRSWRLFQLVGETIGLNVLRYTKVTGTRFQPHVKRGLSNFFRNFLPILLFAENVEEQGNGKDAIVTRLMFPKIIGLHKKWSMFEWIGVANLFYKVLLETSYLSLSMENNSVLLYELYGFLRDICCNLQELVDDEDYEYLPKSVTVSNENEDEDLIDIEVTAMNAPLKVVYLCLCCNLSLLIFFVLILMFFRQYSMTVRNIYFLVSGVDITNAW